MEAARVLERGWVGEGKGVEGAGHGVACAFCEGRFVNSGAEEFREIKEEVGSMTCCSIAADVSLWSWTCICEAVRCICFVSVL